MVVEDLISGPWVCGRVSGPVLVTFPLMRRGSAAAGGSLVNKPGGPTQRWPFSRSALPLAPPGRSGPVKCPKRGLVYRRLWVPVETLNSLVGWLVGGCWFATPAPKWGLADRRG